MRLTTALSAISIGYGPKMGRGRRLIAGVVLALAATTASAHAQEGPVLETPAAALDAALHCPATIGAGRGEPVLLVHGTATNDERSWSWNYAKVLPAKGFDVCTVTLPDRALGDIQVAAEYVVHAVRAMHARSGEQIDVIGHSQGNLEPRWAIKWWPDVRGAVDDMVQLAPPSHGVASAEGLCLPGECIPAGWQMTRGSKFIAVLNAGDETPGSVSFTTIYSLTDELVQPSSTAPVAGGANVSVQSMCPGRPLHHVGLVFDAPTYDLVLDALTRPGAGDPKRVSKLSCLKFAFAGVDPVAGGIVEDFVLYLDAALALAPHERVAQEPALKPYAAG